MIFPSTAAQAATRQDRNPFGKLHQSFGEQFDRTLGSQDAHYCLVKGRQLHKLELSPPLWAIPQFATPAIPRVTLR
jgi:hypothetical protein